MSEKEAFEGGIRLLVPDVSSPEKGEVFYNPIQTLSRDFSVAVYAVLRPETLCDPLSGTGARGLRIAKEVSGCRVTCGDVSESAVESISRNAELNGLAPQSVEIVRENANSLLSKGAWDCVDIDPFGSPVPFFDIACRAAKKFIAVTATDPAALCGVYPRVSKRKYLSSVPVKTEFYHEIGIRVLAGYCIRMAARFDIGLSPVIAHSSNHYYRIYFEKSKSAGRADASLRNVSTLSWCKTCLFREVGEFSECPSCKRKGLFELGPLYTGNLFDSEISKRVAETALEMGFQKAGELASKIYAESRLPAFHYDHHSVCKIEKRPPEKLESFLSSLRERGFLADRTHFSKTGFRTTAPIAEIRKLYL